VAVTLDKIVKAEAMMREMPQVELTTNHYFADGMYARELFRPAGTLIVGKVHKREHFYIVTKGAVQVVMEGESKVITAPAVIVSPPGTKRAVLALEDSVCMTVHRTKHRDLDKIERQLIKKDPLALFDSRNQLKKKALT
jgi:mannose-6-phosphate isomerase-like protein (cupin superfamily)